MQNPIDYERGQEVSLAKTLEKEEENSTCAGQAFRGLENGNAPSTGIPGRKCSGDTGRAQGSNPLVSHPPTGNHICFELSGRSRKGRSVKRIWLALCMVSMLTCSTRANDAALLLKVGAFDVDVSPPIGSPLAYDPCVAVAMSLRANGIVIVGAGQPIVLCSVDWIGISNSAHTAWRRSLASATDTSPERVTVHTVHQHDAPFLDFAADAILAERGLGGLLFDVKFAQQVIDNVSAAAREAKRNAKPVTHLGLGQATVEKVASNRRILDVNGKVRATRYTACQDPSLRLEPEGVIDSRLKSISFWEEDQPVAVMTYYATHPQSYYRRGVANPDFPGMARFLRQVTLNGVPHIHFNGAGGNIGAGKYNDGSPDHRQVLATRMASAMAAAYANTERTPITPQDVTWEMRDVAIPPAPHLDETELLHILDDETAPKLARGNAARDLAWLRRCENGDELTVTSLNLGTASIVHLPGEPVVEYQLYAQQLQPSRFIAVAGYGDYGMGYICLESHYAEGGYEASQRASRVAPHTEHRLKSAIRGVLRARDDELPEPP